MTIKKTGKDVHHLKVNTLKIFRKNSFLIVIFLIFIIPRLVGLGSDIANLDTTHWYPRMDNFTKYLLRGSYKDTYQKYHPGITLLWTSGFAKYSFERAYEFAFHYSPRHIPQQFTKIHFVSKFPLVFLISILGTSSAWILSKIINEKFAYIFAIMLSLGPFFLGVSRFLHLSALTSMFAFTSFLYLYYFYYNKKQNTKYFYISAILLGFGVLTKITASITGITNAFLILFFEIKTHKDFKILFKQYLKYGLVTFTIFYLFFPSMWVAPFWTIKQIKGGGIDDTAFGNKGSKAYFGTQYTYYLEQIFLRSLPTTFISFVVGIYLIFKKTLYKYRHFFVFVLFSLIVVIATLSIPSKVKDRYLVNAYPQISLIASITVYYLLSQKSKIVSYSTITVLTMMYAISIYRYYPVFSYYYTDLIGGQRGILKLGLTVTNRGEYYAQAAQYIDKIDPEANNKNVVVSHRAQDKTFGRFFYGQTFTNPKNLPDGYFADYMTFREDRLSQVPKGCNKLRSFGPRAPFKYDVVTVFKCNGIDNTYKDLRN